MGNLVGVLCVLPVVVLAGGSVIGSLLQYYRAGQIAAVAGAVLINVLNLVYVVSFLN